MESLIGPCSLEFIEIFYERLDYEKLAKMHDAKNTVDGRNSAPPEM